MADDGFLGGLFNDPTKVAALSMLTHVFDPYGKDNTHTLVGLANAKTQQNAMLLALKQAGLDDDTAKAVASHPEAAKMMIEQRRLQGQQASDSAIFGGLGGPSAAPSAAPAAAPSDAPPPPMQQPTPMQPSGTPDFKGAISSIESSGKYDKLGPVTRSGDRAYGKYQVMGANIGQWTKESLGKEMSPQEFLNDPQAQDAVFQSKFGSYAQKYGPEGAARAWFAGEGGMNDPNRKDILGTSVADYARKFNANMGSQGSQGSPPVMAQGGDSPAQPSTPLPQTARGAGPTPQQIMSYIAKYPNASKETKAALLSMYNKAIDEQGATNDIKNYRFYYEQEKAAGREPKPVFEWEQASKKSSGEYSKSPIWGTDEAGNPAIGQLSSSGEMIKTKMPEGFRAGKDVIRVDAGTHTILLDPVTRQQIGMIPKNIEQTKVAEARGEAQGKAITSLPNVTAQGQQALELIDSAIQHPGRETATGLSSKLDPRNLIPGTDAADYMALHNQIRGKVFLDAFNNLRGGGAITEVEGKKAEQAIARLDRSQSDESYKQALYDLRKVLQAGMARAQVMSQGNFSGGQPAAQPSQPSAQPQADPLGIR